jgi:autotransporter-associated beta strand protein
MKMTPFISLILTTLMYMTCAKAEERALPPRPDTSGGGNITVSNGQTTPTFGGLKGPGNLDFGSFITVPSSLTLNTGLGAVCTYSGVLANSASNMFLVKAGAGTQVLAGENTYSGPTVITAGVLQIGVGGTSGRLGAGDVTNSALLVFNRSNDLTVSNLVAGAGSLTKLGAAVLTLTATNDYSGATLVSNGVLRLTHAQALAAGTDVSIAAGAKIRLDFVGTQVVHRLVIGGILQTINKPVGSAQLPAAIEGAGYLRPSDGAPVRGALIGVL